MTEEIMDREPIEIISDDEEPEIIRMEPQNPMEILTEPTQFSTSFFLMSGDEGSFIIRKEPEVELMNGASLQLDQQLLEDHSKEPETLSDEDASDEQTESDCLKPPALVFKCEFCGKSYTEIIILERHKVMMHKPEEMPRKRRCQVCKLSFYELMKHRKKCHPVTSDNEQQFSCLIKGCRKFFDSKDSLGVHMTDHLKNGVKNEDKLEPTEIKPEPEESQVIETLNCYIKKEPELEITDDVRQQRKLKKIRKKNLVISTESDFQMLNCTECGRVFGNKTMLQRHFAVYHEKAVDHQCPKCPKTFELQFDLDRHCKKEHGHGEAAEPEIKPADEKIV